MKSKIVAKQKSKEESEEVVEEYFFKYAFPCAQVKVRLHSLRSEEYNILKDLFLQGNYPSKEELEKTFPAAFRRLRKLTEQTGKEIWDIETLKQYWEQNHNEIIDEGEGMYGIASEEFKDLCKIQKVEIIDKKGDQLIVKYNKKQRIVSNFLIPDAKIGENIRIHFAYAVEKVD